MVYSGFSKTCSAYAHFFVLVRATVCLSRRSMHSLEKPALLSEMSFEFLALLGYRLHVDLQVSDGAAWLK